MRHLELRALRGQAWRPGETVAGGRGAEAMEEQIGRLRRLDRSLAQLPGADGGGRSGVRRAGMRPSYASWKVSGTRPSSDRGVTFHFKHAFVTKGRHGSESWQEITTAAKHQAYIERPSALEREDGAGLEMGAPGPLPEVRLPKGGRAPAEGPEALGLAFPEAIRVPGFLSFGTLGRDKAMRAEFWRKVESAEGRRGRVQCRIILELPHEADQAIRFRIARDFARVFEEKGLPYWCAIHAPSGHNDSRNWHLHIAYHDRPARRTPDGRWDFEIEETYRTAARARRIHYPYRQVKDRNAQGKAWVLGLRRRYADVANFHLGAAGIEKRYDPRPYRESGVLKQATRHLGTRSGIVETYGVETRRGTENVRREVDFRLSQGAIRLRERVAEADAIERRLEGLRRRAPALVAGEVEEGLARLAEARRAAREEARLRQEEEAHRIAAEAVLLRLEQRTRFLDREGERLLMRPPAGVAQDAAWNAAKRLLEERRLALETRPGMEAFAADALAKATEAGEAAAAVGALAEGAIRAAAEAEGRGMEAVGRASGASAAQIADARAAAAIADAIARNTATLDDLDALPPAEPARLRTEIPEETPASPAPAAQDPPVPATSQTEAPPPTPVLPTRAPAAENPAPKALPALPEAAEEGCSAPAHPSGREPAAPEVRADPEALALAALFGEMPVRRKETREDPDAFLLSPRPTAAEIQALQEEVRSLGNRELRRRAIATRDAADLTDDALRRRGHLAAWQGLREIARRRGLDLDTGQHDPRRATDRTEATRHTDSAILPEEEARIRGRGREVA